MIAEIARYAAGIALLAGALSALVAAIGVLRLPDPHARMHAVFKAGTLGAGLALLAVALAAFDAPVVLRAVAGIVLLLLTAPLAAHLLAGIVPAARTGFDDIDRDGENKA